MKITKPEEMKESLEDLEKAIGEVERRLSGWSKGKKSYYINIPYYNTLVHDEIVRLYTDAGWSVKNVNSKRDGFFSFELITTL